MTEMKDMIDIKIRMPKKWFDAFWGWYLDGGGDDGFTTTLDDRELCEEGSSYSDWDKKRHLIVHAETEIQLEEAMKENNNGE